MKGWLLADDLGLEFHGVGFALSAPLTDGVGSMLDWEVDVAAQRYVLAMVCASCRQPYPDSPLVMSMCSPRPSALDRVRRPLPWCQSYGLSPSPRLLSLTATRAAAHATHKPMQKRTGDKSVLALPSTEHTSSNSRRKSVCIIPRVDPDAAGADIGAREIVVCVPADRDDQPVRTFATLTQDLHDLAKCLARIIYQLVSDRRTYDDSIFASLEAEHDQR
jgi:hypothetical protein